MKTNKGNKQKKQLLQQHRHRSIVYKGRLIAKPDNTNIIYMCVNVQTVNGILSKQKTNIIQILVQSQAETQTKPNMRTSYTNKQTDSIFIETF